MKGGQTDVKTVKTDVWGMEERVKNEPYISGQAARWMVVSLSQGRGGASLWEKSSGAEHVNLRRPWMSKGGQQGEMSVET